MAKEFRFPDVGEGITEGEIVRWLVKEGDPIKADQTFAEIETDKAVVEMPSPYAGTVLKLHFKEKDIVKVGDVLITIGEPGEAVAEAPAERAGAGPVPVPAAAASAAAEAAGIQALPAVRKLAADLGVSLAGLLKIRFLFGYRQTCARVSCYHKVLRLGHMNGLACGGASASPCFVISHCRLSGFDPSRCHGTTNRRPEAAAWPGQTDVPVAWPSWPCGTAWRAAGHGQDARATTACDGPGGLAAPVAMPFQDGPSARILAGLGLAAGRCLEGTPAVG